MQTETDIFYKWKAKVRYALQRIQVSLHYSFILIEAYLEGLLCRFKVYAMLQTLPWLH
jgi:hypothetical protein